MALRRCSGQAELKFRTRASLGGVLLAAVLAASCGAKARLPIVPMRGGAPAGRPIDVFAGFVTEQGDAFGRPVGVAIDRGGAVLVADDVGNTIWRVTGRGATSLTSESISH